MRSSSLAIGLFVFCWSAMPAIAACTVPHVIANGQVADANKVMEDINAVADCADAAVTPTGTPTSGAIAVFTGAKTVASGNLSGDVSTSGSTITTLAPSGVVAGSYLSANITVDAKGRVISASNGVGASANRYTHIRLFTGAAGVTFNVNSTGYVRIVPLSFAADLLNFPWTEYQIAVSGSSNQSGQTVTAELHSVSGTNPKASAAGNDLVVSSTFSLYRSGWIPRSDALNGPQEYSLHIKGSNTTVDLSATYIDILLKI